MQIENQTRRTVWVGLYDPNDRLYSATTFIGGARQRIEPGTSSVFVGGFITLKADKQQIVFWPSETLGEKLTVPKEVFTTDAAIAEDSAGVYVYNHLGSPTPADKSAPAVTVALPPPIAGRGSDSAVTVPATTVVAPAVPTTGTTASGHPLNPHPNTPVVTDSIFNSRSFNMAVIDFEFWLREHAGLTDKDHIRAAVYAGLLAIIRAPTPKDQVLLDWLALQVRETRIEAARLALAEYDLWNRDPWSYKPPAGYDFPAYRIAPKNSPMWLSTTPSPPILANQSWQSFLADILSGGGWSALNNPVLKEWQRKPTLEGVIGFPVFGVARTYEKLYATDEGVRTLANTERNLTTRSYDVGSSATHSAIAGVAQVQALRILQIAKLSPYTQRQLNKLMTELKSLVREANELRSASSAGFAPEFLAELSAKNAGEIQALRTVIGRIVSGAALDTFVCAFVLTLALQGLVAESIAVDNKLKLRRRLSEALDEQQRAPLPDLRNLLYHDIRGEVVYYAPEYQPTDPVELERLMGSQEVYLAFLLATIA